MKKYIGGTRSKNRTKSLHRKKNRIPLLISKSSIKHRKPSMTEQLWHDSIIHPSNDVIGGTFPFHRTTFLQILWIRCCDFYINNTWRNFPPFQDYIEHATLVDNVPINVKLSMMTIESNLYTDQITNTTMKKNTVKCRITNTKKNQDITCFPDHILFEIRDAFNTLNASRRIDSDDPMTIVNTLRFHLQCERDDQFLDVFENETKKKKYMFLYLAPPLLKEIHEIGSVDQQYTELMYDYESLHPSFVHIKYAFTEQERTTFTYNPSHESKVKQYVKNMNDDKNSHIVNNLFKHKSKQKYQSHSMFIIILYYFLTLKEKTHIAICINLIEHTTCIFIDKSYGNSCVFL
jgi:hypothetical protein